jgi:hypothetical protein
MSELNKYQHLLLKLREEEYKTKRQIILMSSGLIGLPATLLGTGNLPFINQDMVIYSWLCFILTIIFGVALLKDVTDLNLKAVWYENNDKWLEANLGNPLNKVSDEKIAEKRKVIKSKIDKTDKILHGKLLSMATSAFYAFFILGLVVLALAVVV